MNYETVDRNDDFNLILMKEYSQGQAKPRLFRGQKREPYRYPVNSFLQSLPTAFFPIPDEAFDYLTVFESQAKRAKPASSRKHGLVGDII